MAQAVDITMIGDRELEKKLSRLVDAAQKRAVRPALRASGKRIQQYVAQNLSGKVVKVRTGRLLAAWLAEKVHAIKRTRGFIGVAIDLPDRDSLGIAPEYRWYYPTALEYGTPRMQAKMPFRMAVNDHAKQELDEIGRHIGRNIEREAAKA